MSEHEAALAAETKSFWSDVLLKFRKCDSDAAIRRALRGEHQTLIFAGLFPARVGIVPQTLGNKQRVACSTALTRDGGLFAQAVMMLDFVAAGDRQVLSAAHDGWQVVAKIIGYYGPDGQPADPYQSQGVVLGREVELHIQPAGA